MIIPKKENSSGVHIIKVDAGSEEEFIMVINDFCTFMFLLKVSLSRPLTKTKTLHDSYQFKDSNGNITMYCSFKECLRIVRIFTDKYKMHDIYRLQLVE